MSEKVTLKASFNTFVFSNIFIGLSAVTLSLSSYLILAPRDLYRISLSLLSFIFFSTLFVYNYYITSYSFSMVKPSLKDKWIMENEKQVKVICFLSLAGITYSALFLKTEQILFLLHLGILSLLYIFPVRLGSFEFYLRKLPLIKIFVLTYVWASVTVFLPASDVGRLKDFQTFLVFVERFLFILALAIPFDIRDFEKDKRENVITIPGVLGIQNAKVVSILLLISYGLFSLSIHGLDYVSISRVCSGLFAIFLISKIKDQLEDVFYMFLIDGVMIFHFIVLLLAYILI